ncbi:Zn-dependent hydrolase [Nonomuraea soli]|uniref:Hydantoinase/carbamoylase family amidase n=1 Tax=Nonomuraea soli TaxID=1032476 RepID=A0A7W0CHJ1_9ACTN|nr:Zn-dependent hydrolase [Nonomuraea soli]MBA2891259.1 hydantoinase/carbamoylase family amidase [Nonomuraea soli]
MKYADPARLAALIDRLATISDAGPGVTRLAYTPLERQAHEVFADHMSALGLKVWSDAAGNTIAERQGSEDLPALGTGSHLDSVPRGGRFDGIAGVVAAMEVATILADSDDLHHRRPLRFVAFAAEEGARFGLACLGSRLAAGLNTPDDLERLKDADGVSVAEAMRGVGLDPALTGEARWDPQDWYAFVELHVEQGDVLERAGLPIGVVDTVSGSTRLRLDLIGRPSHTGATPMAGRSDALVAAAQVVLAADAVAGDARHRGTRATVGELRVSPGSVTTIPGQVSLSLDVRDVDSDRQRRTAAEIVRHAQAAGDDRGVRLDYRLIGDSSPVVLPLWIRDVLTAAAASHGAAYRVMTSGASHDAQIINKIIPAGMLFVPSRSGVSHVPEEWTSPEELATGVDVLLSALLRLSDEGTS